MKHKLFVNVKGRMRRWAPSGLTRTATPRSRREQRIADLICDGRTEDFAEAIILMRRGCDYDRLLDLGREYHKPCRVIKAVVTANQIFSGEIPPSEAPAYVRGLAASAGHGGVS